jgi:hypothetical protein
MTHDLDYPYITNKRENDLGVVNPPPTSFVDPSTMTGIQAITRSRVKCSPTNLDIYADVPQPIQVGDYIIVKRVYSHWHFVRHDRYRFYYMSGTQQNVIPILDHFDRDYEYLVVWVEEEIPAQLNYRFRFAWLTNTPYANNEAWIHLHTWSSKIKTVSGLMNPSSISLEGGIHYRAEYWDDTLDTRHYAQVGSIAGYHRPARIRFRNCMQVPPEGEIQITFYEPGKNPITQWGSDIQFCRVWREINKQYANETHVRCDYDPATHAVSINTFDYIPKIKWLLYFHWIGNLKDDPIPYTVGEMDYMIETFNVTGDATTRTDWIWNNYNFGATAGEIVGGFEVTKKFPPHRDWHKFRKYQYEIY